MSEDEFDDSEAVAEVLQIFANASFTKDIEENDELVTSEMVDVSKWTPEDFSRVYVKYRPALSRYAHRFLSDSTEVDEVIQDAFLYLFLSLPELDSEIGILKFLKWKTRLLAFDAIRVSGRRPLFVTDDPEWSDLDSETIDGPESMLDRMHDAAIVHAALARISERHREVLIRSEFKEETTLEIGASFGLTENATRQLVHRARRTFKQALIEIVEQNGHSVSETLSVAVKKAKKQAKNIGALVLLIAITSFIFGRSEESYLNNYVAQPTADEEFIEKPENPETPEKPKKSKSLDKETKPADMNSAPLSQITSETSEVIRSSSMTDEANFNKMNAVAELVSVDDGIMKIKISSTDKTALLSIDNTGSSRRFEVLFELPTGVITPSTVLDFEQVINETNETQLTVLVYLGTAEEMSELSKLWFISVTLDSQFLPKESALLINN